MPIVWLSHIFGIPLKERVAGATIFFAIKNMRKTSPLSTFIFGGGPGVASIAAARLVAEPGGLKCAGYLDPGFGTVEELSSTEIIEAINASNADFLSVSLGAAKGQAWLMHNRDAIRIPVQTHLGATINFQAGNIRRAPDFLQRAGLEWIWRIKEEPHLWRRYFDDSLTLARMILGRALPLWFYTRMRQREASLAHLDIRRIEDAETITLVLTGTATASTLSIAVPHFRSSLNTAKSLVLDLGKVSYLDTRFVGLILMARKMSRAAGANLTIASASKSITMLLKLNGFDFLLKS
jgi:N-acetylglucosaminyldiphosphoundecaprenol N-acetyl-beta-D-mannosaminyltransferase